MSSTEARSQMQSGGFLGILNVLMQLRMVGQGGRGTGVPAGGWGVR